MGMVHTLAAWSLLQLGKTPDPSWGWFTTEDIIGRKAMVRS